MSLIPCATTRRVFLLQLAATGGTALAATPVPSDTPAAVSETDPTAAALGYVADNARADKKKYPQFTSAQKCSACALYQGKGGATGPCPIFAGKLVASGGWCSSWTKKA